MNEFLNIDKKKLKKYLKNRDVFFCVVTYPAILFIYITLRIYMAVADTEAFSPGYTLVSFLILSFMAILTIIERIDTKFSHKAQGDKLKLKRVDNSWKS